MITLYTFGPAWGLPDPSPFVMKADMTLKLSGLPYETNTRGFGKAPKGKLPYIRDGETLIADSTLIRLYLEQKYGIDFDRALTPRERGVAWAVEKMLEEHMYWIMVSWRWLDDENFARGPKAFFKRAPAIIRPMVEKIVRRKIRKNLHSQGIGRHSLAETTAMASRAIDGLSQSLGDNRYFFGAQTCGADATLFAFICGGLAPQFKGPVTDKLAATANLVAYRDRMLAEFYPDFPKPGSAKN
jgi:glutathione S-transferase